jgi:putative copper export protein
MRSYDAGMMRFSWLVACLCCVVVLAGVGVGVFFAIRASQRRNP